MLSENLQHGIGGDEPAQACVPHGSQVLAMGFIEGDGKPVFVQPFGCTIGGQARSKSLCVLDSTRLNGK